MNFWKIRRKKRKEKGRKDHLSILGSGQQLMQLRSDSFLYRDHALEPPVIVIIPLVYHLVCSFTSIFRIHVCKIQVTEQTTWNRCGWWEQAKKDYINSTGLLLFRQKVTVICVHGQSKQWKVSKRCSLLSILTGSHWWCNQSISLPLVPSLARIVST